MRLTEKEVIAGFKRLYSKAKPLRITVRKLQDGTAFGRIDAIGTVELDGKKCADVAIEYVSTANPKNLINKAIILKDAVKDLNKKNIILLIVAPYIGDKQMQILDERDVSWIDLCGNAKLNIPGCAYIERLGNKNKFPDTASIKKIFSGASGLVSRALLLKPNGFKSQYELADFINSRNGQITTSTVSRVVSQLSEELLVKKTKDLIKVIEPETLLDNLLGVFTANINRGNCETFRFNLDDIAIQRLLEPAALASIPLVECVACGYYAAKLKELAVTDEVKLFVKSIEKFRAECEQQVIIPEPDSEYGNVEIVVNEEPGAWFNKQFEKDVFVVDDIELYLEMANDRPRGPKIAGQLKERILAEFKNE